MSSSSNSYENFSASKSSKKSESIKSSDGNNDNKASSQLTIFYRFIYFNFEIIKCSNNYEYLIC